MNAYQSASSLLLDNDDPVNIGGSGEVFNWNLIPESLRTKVILAGGLNSENVGDAIKIINTLRSRRQHRSRTNIKRRFGVKG